jgi:general secretion pathway protein L
MNSWLGIHLESNQPGGATVVHWVLHDGERQLALGSDELDSVRAAAGPAAEKAEVHVFVQGSGVMLTEVNIPSRNATHLRKALPFMIEEQLAGDLRKTHLAVAPHRSGDTVSVAVVAHAQMIEWLEALHAANLSPVSLIPEQLLLPREPGSISVHIHRNRALVRMEDYSGVVVDLENLVLIVELALNQRAIPCSRIEISSCAGCDEDERQADALGTAIAERLDRPIRRTSYQEPLVELLASEARHPRQCLNLCQGGYRMDARGGDRASRWRVTRIVAAACILVFVIACYAGGVLMEWRARAVHEQAVALFLEMFPDERRVINLRRQAQARLRAAGSGADESLHRVAALAGVLESAELAGIRLQTLRFDGNAGALSAELSAPSLTKIDMLGEMLVAAGMNSKVLSASEEDGVASARLELRSP